MPGRMVITDMHGQKPNTWTTNERNGVMIIIMNWVLLESALGRRTALRLLPQRCHRRWPQSWRPLADLRNTRRPVPAESFTL
eukprot:5696076-Amphidinium_carterae.1